MRQHAITLRSWRRRCSACWPRLHAHGEEPRCTGDAAGLVACIAGQALQLRLRARQPGDRTAGRIPLGLRHPAPDLRTASAGHARPLAGRAAGFLGDRPLEHHHSAGQRPSRGAGRAAEVVDEQVELRGSQRRWRWPCRCWTDAAAGAQQRSLTGGRPAPAGSDAYLQRQLRTLERATTSPGSAEILLRRTQRDLISQSRGVYLTPEQARIQRDLDRVGRDLQREQARARRRRNPRRARAASGCPARSTTPRPCPALAARSPWAGWSAGRRARWPRAARSRRART